MILTDDQGWGDMQSHGNPFIETPTLNQLAAEGAEFERFYVSPLCAPSRASILTGRYHLKTGVTSVSNGLEIMDEGESTLAELFKSNGYSTGIFGKWHNGSHHPNRPTDQGFDEFIGFCAGHWSNYFNTTLDSADSQIKSSGFITDFLTAKAIDFMQRKKDKPFFCYVPFNAPHSPFQVPDKYFNKYKEKGLDDRNAAVYGLVENVDDNIAKLLQSLEDNGLSQNTIVIFLTDNGPNGERYNGEMKGIKGHVDEGGVRVPCIFRWPGHIPAERKIDGLAAHIDLYPTLSSLCGLNPIATRPIDGIDLAQVLVEEKEIPERTLFSHVAFLDKVLHNKPGALRTLQYRFVLKKDKPELYDMQHDPSQKQDISGDKQDLTRQFLDVYNTWFNENSGYFEATKPIRLDFDHVALPSYESQFKGNIRFEEGHGWAHDWLINWSGSQDEIQWLVESKQTTQRKAAIQFTCNSASIGSEIVLKIDGETVCKASVTQAVDFGFLDSPDRIPRKEAYEKSAWGKLDLGNFTISPGIHTISLSSPKPKVAQEIALKSLLIQKP
ncbi:arylsulfatase [Marinilongibacter aquaticus]|uniref:arylsulfatase n=1 Tax=Marinilongibacter aquaticus TaxID=2975157 RepID=UPI0021BD2EF2|nr:arylsulfatase [Marinilongibacter aquaticus]